MSLALNITPVWVAMGRALAEPNSDSSAAVPIVIGAVMTVLLASVYAPTLYLAGSMLTSSQAIIGHAGLVVSGALSAHWLVLGTGSKPVLGLAVHALTVLLSAVLLMASWRQTRTSV